MATLAQFGTRSGIYNSVDTEDTEISEKSNCRAG
jgi:hypothetical protein